MAAKKNNLLILCFLLTLNISLFSQSKSLDASNSLLDLYDVSFYKLDLTVSGTSASISGTVTINAKAVDNLSTFALELDNGMTVSAIRINNVNKTFTHSGNLIQVTLGQTLSINTAFSVEVDYSGSPATQNPSFIGFIKSSSTVSGVSLQTVYTVSEPRYSKSWWPCKQVLSDKADSVYIFLTTPKTEITASNGLMKNRVDLGTKYRYEWKHIHPIAYYHVCFASGNYQYDNSVYAHPNGTTDSIRIQNILPSTSYYTTNQSSIASTSALMVNFCDKFGMYPFSNEKYGHLYVPGTFGALENQTMTAMTSFSYTLIAHEMSHQWFGNNVSANSWQEIWLHEGFGRYAEYLALQLNPSYGSPSAWLSTKFSSAMTAPYTDKKNSVYIPAENVGDFYRIFNDNLSYNKGAALVHMIRYEVGSDSLFFDILKTYNSRFAGKNATYSDFMGVLNEKTSRDFTDFFNQWYFGEGYPTYNLQWYQSNNEIHLKMVQSTSSTATPLYKMHVPIRLTYSGGTINLNLDQFTNNQYYKIPCNSTITSVVVDPDNWILNGTGSVSNTTFTTPVFAQITGDLTACDTGFIYTNCPSSYTFEWKDIANGTNLGTNDSLAVSTTGTYAVIVTDNITQLKQADTAIVEIFNRPVVTFSGSQTICSGDTAALDLSIENVTPNTAITLSSTTGNDTVIIVNTKDHKFWLNPKETATYTISNAITEHCSVADPSQIATVTVVVNKRPVVTFSGDQTICSGDTAALNLSIENVTPNTAITLSSTTGNDTVITVGIADSKIALTPASTTTYSITNVTSENCSVADPSQIATVTVVVNKRPVVTFSGDQTICSGDTATLNLSIENVTPNTAITLSSTTGSDTVITVGIADSKIALTPASTTTYSITNVTTETCSVVDLHQISTVTVSVNDCSVSSKTLTEEKSTKIFPNPASDILTIIDGEEFANIKIYDYIGTMVMDESLTSTRKVDLKNLPAGCYMILLNGSKLVYSQKIMIVR